MSAATLITEGRHYEVNEDGCWMWKLSLTRDGYARASSGQLGHRRSYVENVGPLDKGQPLDHLCRNRSCVNPTHLEPVTIAENSRRSLVARGLVDRTHCSEGHDMSDPYVEPLTGNRKCRECRRIWSLNWYHRNKQAAA